MTKQNQTTVAKHWKCNCEVEKTKSIHDQEFKTKQKSDKIQIWLMNLNRDPSLVIYMQNYGLIEFITEWWPMQVSSSVSIHIQFFICILSSLFRDIYTNLCKGSAPLEIPNEELYSSKLDPHIWRHTVHPASHITCTPGCFSDIIKIKKQVKGIWGWDREWDGNRSLLEHSQCMGSPSSNIWGNI